MWNHGLNLCLKGQLFLVCFFLYHDCYECSWLSLICQCYCSIVKFLMKVEAVSRIATVPHLFETVGEAPCDHQQMFDLHFPLTWNITWSKNPSSLGYNRGWHTTYTTQFTCGLLHKPLQGSLLNLLNNQDSMESKRFLFSGSTWITRGRRKWAPFFTASGSVLRR